ncbi:MAG: nitroreductase family protein [Candidatus Kerfeldbacteria bacterium]|nr:nitroreductase family protein [Candidatus Kerfeldbacteria bacterium]
MTKDTPLDHPIHELLASRWSSRAIDPAKSIPKDVMMQVLEAARWAPSSRNEQPWRFIIFTKDKPAELEKAHSTLSEGNAWAKHAPVLLLSVAKLFFDLNGKENRHAVHDLGLATENLILQAAALGLVTHQMAGFDHERARALFQIPQGFEPMTMIVLANPGDLLQLDAKSQEKEKAARTRLLISEFTFDCTWGSTISS